MQKYYRKIMDIKLTTPNELISKANEIDHNLRHKEPKRITWWCKFTKTVKAFYLRIIL